MDSDFDDPTDFQNLAFQGLDEHLRCPICKEFFETAMILATCSHTFCSLCIRRSLSAEEFCPSCRNPAIESKLHNNYVVDYLVGIWKNNR
jgi:E3 ubiquitin-protein ligase RAD18